MKKLAVILFLYLAATSTVKSQSNDLQYKPFSDFGNDSVAYLMYNFDDRANYYEGKTLYDVITDLQVPIDSYFGRYRPDSPHYFLRLFFNSNTNILSQNIHYLYVTTDTNFLDSVRWSGKWSDDIFQKLKSIKIVTVGIVVDKSSKHYKKEKERKVRSKPQIIIDDSQEFHQWDPSKLSK